MLAIRTVGKRAKPSLSLEGRKTSSLSRIHNQSISFPFLFSFSSSLCIRHVIGRRRARLHAIPQPPLGGRLLLPLAGSKAMAILVCRLLLLHRLRAGRRTTRAAGLGHVAQPGGGGHVLLGDGRVAAAALEQEEGEEGAEADDDGGHGDADADADLGGGRQAAGGGRCRAGRRGAGDLRLARGVGACARHGGGEGGCCRGGAGGPG